MSYGTLGLSAWCITILEIVMVMLYVIAAVLYEADVLLAATIVHLFSSSSLRWAVFIF